MKILITGAGGQLGCALQSSDCFKDYVALTSTQLNIVDITQVRDAISMYNPDIVINAAAVTNVDDAQAGESRAYAVNAVGPRNLAIATNQKNIPLVHISTDYVFDGAKTEPYHEFDPVNPLSIYGKSKLAGEYGVSAHNPRHYIVRTAWFYHYEPATAKNFPRIMADLAKTKSEVGVVNDQFGSPTYAPHFIDALRKLINYESYGTYHIAGSGGGSRFDFARELYRLLGIGINILPRSTNEFPRPAPRPRYSVLTTMQHPTVILPSWEEGLSAFVKKAF